MCIFVLLGVYLQDEILEVGLLNQKVNAQVILLDIAKFPFICVVPVFLPTSNKRACSFSITKCGPFACGHYTHPSCLRLGQIIS